MHKGIRREVWRVVNVAPADYADLGQEVEWDELLLPLKLHEFEILITSLRRYKRSAQGSYIHYRDRRDYKLARAFERDTERIGDILNRVIELKESTIKGGQVPT